jgi:hypothetical protein
MNKKITWKNENPKNEKSKKENHMKKKPEKKLKIWETILSPHKLYETPQT